jgi:hypothetical protein
MRARPIYPEIHIVFCSSAPITIETSTGKWKLIVAGSSQCKVSCLDYVVAGWAFIVSLAQFDPHVERISTIEVNSVPVSLTKLL